MPAHMVYRLKWQNEAEMAPAGGGDIMKDDEYHQSHSLKPDQVYFLTVANGVRDVTVTMGDGTVISLTLGPGNGIEIRAGHDSKGMVVRLYARKTGIVGGLKPPAPRGDLGLRTGQEPKKRPRTCRGKGRDIPGKQTTQRNGRGRRRHQCGKQPGCFKLEHKRC